MTARPTVDVVVPVAASAARVRALALRMRELDLRDGDTLRVVDNRDVGVDEPEVVVAAGVRTSYHARNAGAALGEAEWLLFLDSDVEPPADLLDRLFDPLPREHTAVLAGEIADEPVGERAPAAVRYAYLKNAMRQETVLTLGRWSFAQTANCAVRRSAFEAIGGFREGVRSGGDADLCFRLTGSGWEIERRPHAEVVHRNRQTVPRMLAQRARHGAGSAWLAREHPGAMPRRKLPGLLWWSTRRLGAGLAAFARGDRDAALLGLLDGPAVWAFELGRLIPIRPRPRSRRSQR